MIDFQALNAQLAPFDDAAAQRAVDKWNAVAKPIASLGKLEDIVSLLASPAARTSTCPSASWS